MMTLSLPAVPRMHFRCIQARSLKEGVAHTALLEGNMAALLSGFQGERDRMKV